MKTKTKAEQHVHICIWETSGNDPCVWVARTEKRLYKAVWLVIAEYWADVVGKAMPSGDPIEDVRTYAKACQERENGEYFTFSKEELL